MRKKSRSLNALKHGVYSNLGLLPGEDPDEYLEHWREVLQECQPEGPTEESIATDIADVLWRKKNLKVYQHYARFAKKWQPVLAGANEPGFSLEAAILQFASKNLTKLRAHLELADTRARSEEHTSELQSLRHLVCR